MDLTHRGRMRANPVVNYGVEEENLKQLSKIRSIKYHLNKIYDHPQSKKTLH
jgi:hypothetical protein